MGIPVLILGESGSGKSASLRNFGEQGIVIYNIASKPLPFRKKMDFVSQGATYEQIKKSMARSTVKSYVIDDSQYLMAFEFFDKANIKGYDKFTEIAVNFRNLIQFIVSTMSSDTIVYFLHHTETSEYGGTKAKTVGKMLDQQLTLEGLFSIVLKTKVDSDSYNFTTQNSGNDTCKSPMEMFALTIDNDLKYVDDTIREYYKLGGADNEQAR